MKVKDMDTSEHFNQSLPMDKITSTDIVDDTNHIILIVS